MKRAIVLVLMLVAVLVPLAGANADLKSDQAIPQARNGASSGKGGFQITPSDLRRARSSAEGESHLP